MGTICSESGVGGPHKGRVIVTVSSFFWVTSRLETPFRVTSRLEMPFCVCDRTDVMDIDDETIEAVGVGTRLAWNMNERLYEEEAMELDRP